MYVCVWVWVWMGIELVSLVLPETSTDSVSCSQYKVRLDTHGRIHSQ